MTLSPSPSLTINMTPTTVSISLNGKVVVDGSYSLISAAGLFAPGDVEPQLGTPVSFMKMAGPNSVIIIQQYARFTALHLWTFTGEDIKISSYVRNNSDPTPLKIVGFTGLNVHFSKDATGFLPSWHWTYLNAVGTDLMHPSNWVQIGAIHANDGVFGIGAYSDSHLLKRKMLHALFRGNGIIPAETALEFYIPETIEMGQARTFDLSIRISGNTNWQYLLAPYKAAFQRVLPPIQYPSDNRPLGYFSAVDATWVRPDNPYGFGDNLGTTGWRRLDFDKDETTGVRAFAKVVGDPLVQCNGQGCIMWCPQGYNQRGAMYRTDFDIFPPQIAATMPALIAAFKARGLRIGLATRPGEATERVTWDSDDTSRLSTSSRSQMDRLWSRFDKMIKLGFNIFYLDTFGSDLNDFEIMRMLRAKMGPDIPTYAEYVSDIILPFTGRYVEVNNGALSSTTPELVTIQRWLVPGAIFLGNKRDGLPWDSLGPIKLSPLVQDWMIQSLVPDLQAFNLKYLSGKDWK